MPIGVDPPTMPPSSSGTPTLTPLTLSRTTPMTQQSALSLRPLLPDLILSNLFFQFHHPVVARVLYPFLPLLKFKPPTPAFEREREGGRV